MTEFEIPANGPFSLAAAQDFAGGFTPGIGGGSVGEKSIAMSFPIEGRASSAAAELSQREDGVVVGRTDAPAVMLDAVVRQASRCLSLDHDGSSWPKVGERDAVIGRLQKEHGFLRPVCFYSAYEAATSFVIGQRISRAQGARVKEWLRNEYGDRPTVDGHAYPAFPRPEVLLNIGAIKGLSTAKLGWLHGLAQAALDGRLDSEKLRAMPYSEALTRLRQLPGIGAFTAEGTMLRGTGVADELPANDKLSLDAARDLYGEPDMTRAAFEQLAETWRPYQMWAIVLMRVGWGRARPGQSYRRSI